MYTNITACRLCKSTRLKTVFDFGSQYVVTFVPKEELDEWKAGKREQPIPLTVVMCEDCTFVQLRESVDPDRMYKKFWYKSGINESMKVALKDVVTSALKKVDTQNRPGKYVLDIGSNDGTLLSFYDEWSIKVGYDPAENLCEDAKRIAKTPFIYPEYFNESAFDKHGTFDIITAIAMFYDLEDPRAFLQTIHRCLKDTGVFVIQMNYLATMMKNGTVDNISHEHLGYYSLYALEQLLKRHGFMIRDAVLNDVNGGSIRVFVAKEGYKATDEEQQRVQHLLLSECEAGLRDPATYEEFYIKLQHTLTVLREYLQDYPWPIYVYGASTRGTSLLQLLNLPEGLLKGAAERNPEKYGLHMVGSWVPIVSEAEARRHASLFLVLPYHFKAAILEREDAILKSNVKFLFPLPEPTIYMAYGL